MAQTKRKRRTKHRGNAAGMVETRGRTGRPPTAAERKAAAKGSVKTRVDRRELPPTWRSAANRAAIAAVIFAVALIVVFGRPVAEGVVLAASLLVLYVPMTFYTDKFLYTRFQKRKAQGG